MSAEEPLEEHSAVIEEFEEHGVQRHLEGAARLVLTAAALAFSAYQLAVAAFSPLSSQVTRSLHVGFLLGIAEQD